MSLRLALTVTVVLASAVAMFVRWLGRALRNVIPFVASGTHPHRRLDSLKRGLSCHSPTHKPVEKT